MGAVWIVCACWRAAVALRHRRYPCGAVSNKLALPVGLHDDGYIALCASVRRCTDASREVQSAHSMHPSLWLVYKPTSKRVSADMSKLFSIDQAGIHPL
jgi:hypothetical protein